MSKNVRFGLLVFPNVTQLDMTGPLQVFSFLPGAEVHLLWKNTDAVQSDGVLSILPTTALTDCPQLDVICVPGGYGTDALMADPEVLDFLRRQASGARYVTSVCTGSLVLAAAGLLDGYRAATHWSAVEALALFDVTVSRERVCIDRNRMTGGGVTAGIDLGLTIIARLLDRQAAETIQLRMEYNPAPPFDAGSPETAPAEVLAVMEDRFRLARQQRMDLVRQIRAGHSPRPD